MKIHQQYLFLAAITGLIACSDGNGDFDASGSFESIERTISAEAMGKILELDIREGSVLKAGDTIGRIDVTELQLQAEQIEAAIAAIGDKTNDASPQIDILNAQLNTQKGQIGALEQQMATLEKEIDRFQKLVEAKAAPQKTLDDLQGQQKVLAEQLNTARAGEDVIRQQISAAKRNVALQNRAVLSEVEPNQKRLDIIREKIDKAWIINPYPGTVTTQMAYAGEFTGIGKPLYRIADLEQITLRTYISADQLPGIRLNDTVRVFTDNGGKEMRETTGVVTWISDKAEFTPKTIQTKNERANKVYAVKVLVDNDGTYKLGMYGEIKFDGHE